MDKSKIMVKSKMMISKLIKIKSIAKKILSRKKIHSQATWCKILKVKKSLRVLISLRTNRWKAKMIWAFNQIKKFKYLQFNKIKIKFYNKMKMKLFNKSNPKIKNHKIRRIFLKSHKIFQIIGNMSFCNMTEIKLVKKSL